MSGATTAGTKRTAERGRAAGLPAFSYRPLGRTGLTTSALGFGTYRVDERTPEHAAALVQSLERGVNLIDTSTNYTDGSSERTIGAVLATRPREETIVVSKVGYVQGQALALSRSREREGQPFGEMVKYTEGCWHCLHPGFVADQLTRSLDRLRLQTIDVYLLHNPEYFFSDAVKRKQTGDLGALRDEFYRRIASAFAQLEDEVKRGRIAWYGVSSNTFGAAFDDPEATSLDRMHAIAERITPQHHFAVVQLPANLYESGPMLTANNTGNTLSALTYASVKNLAVLANRPLNAYKDERLVRLADGAVPNAPATVVEQLAKVAGLEARAPRKGVAWGTQLVAAARSAQNLQQWRQIEAQVSAQFGPRLQEAAAGLKDAQAGAFQTWAAEYTGEIRVLLAALGAEAAGRGRAANAGLHKTLDAHLPKELHGWSLSQKANAALLHTPGITCVLNGMRRPEYVDDALGALAGPDFRTAAALYEALR